MRKYEVYYIYINEMANGNKRSRGKEIDREIRKDGGGVIDHG